MILSSAKVVKNHLQKHDVLLNKTHITNAVESTIRLIENLSSGVFNWTWLLAGLPIAIAGF